MIMMIIIAMKIMLLVVLIKNILSYFIIIIINIVIVLFHWYICCCLRCNCFFMILSIEKVNVIWINRKTTEPARCGRTTLVLIRAGCAVLK